MVKPIWISLKQETVSGSSSADLHMAQRMPLPLTVSCFSKIQIDFSFLVLAHPGSPGQRSVKWVCVCFSSIFCFIIISHSALSLELHHIVFFHILVNITY